MIHLKDVGETYFQHMHIAVRSGFLLLFAGVACIVHGILPMLFSNVASSTVKRISDVFKDRDFN